MTVTSILNGFVAARVVVVELPSINNNVVGPIPDADLLLERLDARSVEGPLVNGCYAITVDTVDGESEEALVERFLAAFREAS